MRYCEVLGTGRYSFFINSEAQCGYYAGFSHLHPLFFLGGAKIITCVFPSLPFPSLPFLLLPSPALPSSPLPSPSPFLLPQTCLSLSLWRKIRLGKQILCFCPGVVNPYLSWDEEVWRAVCKTIPICVSAPSIRGAESSSSTLEKGRHRSFFFIFKPPWSYHNRPCRNQGINCMYVCICMHVCICVQVYVCMYVHVCEWCVCRCVYVCMYMYMSVCVHVCVYVHVDECVCVHM